MTYRLLMVCTGNICRSAMAEVILNDYLQREGLDAVVDSAGISDEEHGGPIDYRAAKTLKRAGYAVPHHRAHQIQAPELRSYDLVLAMTSHHYNALERLATRAGVEIREGGPVGDPAVIDLRMFRSFDPAAGQVRHRRDLDVPDPWYGDQSDFEQTLETIEAAALAIVDHVRARG